MSLKNGWGRRSEGKEDVYLGSVLTWPGRIKVAIAVGGSARIEGAEDTLLTVGLCDF